MKTTCDSVLWLLAALAIAVVLFIAEPVRSADEAACVNGDCDQVKLDNEDNENDYDNYDSGDDFLGHANMGAARAKAQSSPPPPGKGVATRRAIVMEMMARAHSMPPVQDDIPWTVLFEGVREALGDNALYGIRPERALFVSHGATNKFKLSSLSLLSLGGIQLADKNGVLLDQYHSFPCVCLPLALSRCCFLAPSVPVL
jgi:hypothetical protein